jgi:phosphate transport system substrate-binding protein
MMRYALVAALAGLLGSSAAFAAPFEIHGSTTVAANLMTPKKAEIEKASGVELLIVGNGSGRGLADLLEGKVQVAMISAPLEDEVKALKAKGTAFDETKMKGFSVGSAFVAFGVNPSNPVKKLTEAQMSDILTGKIANWKDVGGADKPIIVICESKGGGVRTQVEHELLNGGDITAQKRELPNPTEVPKIVAQLDGALGIFSKVSMIPGVTELDAGKKIGQPLILVTMGDPTPDVAKVIAAAKAAGGN